MSLAQKSSVDTKIELQHTSQHSIPSDPNFRLDPAKPSVKAQVYSEPRSAPQKPGFISLLHFFFVVKLVRFIHSLKNRSPTEEDLRPLVYSRTCQPLEALFTQYYYELRSKYQGQPRLLPTLLYKIFKKEFYVQIAWQALYVMVRILEPYFLYLTLISLRNPREPLGNAYAAAVGLFISFIIETYAFHQFNFNAAFTVNGIKIGLLGMLFRKLNKISLLSLQKLSFGKLLNVVSVDSNNLDNLHFILFIPLLPLTYGGSIVLLCYWWGPSGLVAIGYMMAVNLFQYFVAIHLQAAGKQRSYFLDERIRILNEVLEGIRVIKMHTWESFVLNKVSKIRRSETKAYTKLFSFFSIARAFTFSSQYVAAFFLLLTYNEVDGNITAAKIFPTLLLLGSLKQLAMIYPLLGFLYKLLLMIISLRTYSIMDLPEVEPVKAPRVPVSPEHSIEFQDFSGYWTKKDMGPPPFLKPPPPKPPKNAPPPSNSVSSIPAVSKINLQIKTGELVAVVGQTGAGKSSLLLSFTREMIKTEGELRYTGSIEYVSQEPILFAIPIRETITYGRQYDDELFWKVVEACCLSDMIASLPKKEFSEMAERGLNLSGAQKMQILLARALYSKADIYLLDDPFSSFDTRLGKQIFRKAVQEFLKDATVVLVTHNLDFAKHANKIVILKSGSITAQGTYSELAHEETEKGFIGELRARAKYEKHEIEQFGHGREYDEVQNPLLGQKKDETIGGNSAIDLADDDDGLFVENERLDDGKVTLKIYWKYFRTIFNWWNIVPFIILFAAPEAVGWQFMIRISSWLLGVYSDSQAYGILAGMAFGSMIIYAVKYPLYYICGLNGARKLHDKMLKGMLHSPLKFFVTNKVGRILNRFANDITQLDNFILNAFLEILEGLCFFLIYMIALWVQEPWILVPAGITLIGFLITFLCFHKTINMTRGLELSLRGPVYSFFSNITNGLTIFRVRDQTENLMKAFYRRADDYARANVAHGTSLRLMSFLLDYITQLAVIGTLCFYIGEKGSTIVKGPFVNMVISLPVTMQWLLKNFMNFHALMSSVARIINYSENYKGIEVVKPKDQELEKSGWPHGGEIDIKHASMRYGEHKPLFLKDLNIHIKSGEKVAVVGESSFGMTSLINMVARVLHIEPRPDAYVKIDGVDVEDIGVNLIRRSMTVIHVHHVFTGTIRENLDMCKKHTDEELWQALEIAGLKDYIQGLDAKLETYYTRGSSLFSAGQKQLLSLARSVLKKDSHIFIQDRATNNVDILTDHQVQKNLRERYHAATTLMTTYRLWYVGGFDKVLCMKDGKMIEFDEPYRLLVKEIGDKEITNKQGYFAGLVLDMNPKIAKQTFKLSMIAYYKKHNMQLDEEEIYEGLKLLQGPFEDELERQRENGENTQKLTQKNALQEVERNCLY